MNLSFFRSGLIVAVIWLMANCAPAQVVTYLVAVTGHVTNLGPTSSIIDVNTATGTGSNARNTGILLLGGIAWQASTETLFGLTTNVSSPANALVAINLSTGAPLLVGPTGLPGIVEGDISFNPLNGMLYGVQDTGVSGVQRNLFRINPLTGVAAVVGNIPSQGDFSALAFAPNGTLYTIDTSGSGNSLLQTLDPSSGMITGTVNMNADLGSTAGMVIDPVSGTVYVGDGGMNATNSVYTLDLNSGELTLIGPVGIAGGIAGLSVVAVPEPSGIILFGTAASVILLRRRISRVASTKT